MGERALVRSVFGDAVDCDPVRIRRRKWFLFQPAKVTMAPQGHIHFHPQAGNYCEDFASADLMLQGHFIHEMTHVWQSQRKGRWYLPIHRHPFCRYDYVLKAGRPLDAYGIEQQAEIVRHAFLLRRGVRPAGIADPAAYDRLVDFQRA